MIIIIIILKYNCDFEVFSLTGQARRYSQKILKSPTTHHFKGGEGTIFL